MVQYDWLVAGRLYFKITGVAGAIKPGTAFASVPGLLQVTVGFCMTVDFGRKSCWRVSLIRTRPCDSSEGEGVVLGKYVVVAFISRSMYSQHLHVMGKACRNRTGVIVVTSGT